MIRIRSTRCDERQAVTLIELLIVVGLLVILASISLGALKTMLRGHKVSQAAITVRQYLQNAQMRAVANGRPVAVFLDRLGLTGNGIEPVAANYTVTRLQLGEVFPPYTGDIAGAKGRVIQIGSLTPDIGYGDALFFPTAGDLSSIAANVASGFGELPIPSGFLSVGDAIQVEDCAAIFQITNISPHTLPPGIDGLLVTFENPAIAPNQIPLNGTPALRKFSVYRQPTRSLASSIVLPRGTCVDLSVSGLGINDFGAQSSSSFFRLDKAPDLNTVSPPSSNFSRIALVFNSDGRLSYMFDESTFRPNSLEDPRPRKVFKPVNSTLFLMVGRTEQVLPGLNPPTVNQLRAATQHPEFNAAELPPANIVNPESLWVYINPVTGEVKTSPTADISATLTAGVPPVELTSDMVIQSRALAAAGMTNSN